MASQVPIPGTTPPTDPFASMGGGTYFSNIGAWAPNNNPGAIAAYTTQNGGPGTGAGTNTPGSPSLSTKTDPIVPGGPTGGPFLSRATDPNMGALVGAPAPSGPTLSTRTDPIVPGGYQPIAPPPVPPNNQPQTPSGPPIGNPLQNSVGTSIDSLLNSAGAVNQNVINSQIDSARGTLDQQRNAQLSQDQAELADRGLLGSGTEGNAMQTLDKNIAQTYGSDLSGILGNEYNNANQRMMAALTTGAGLSQQEAQQYIDQYNAQTGRAGTLGELGLQGQAIGSQYELGNRGLDIQSKLGQEGIDLSKLLGEGQQGIEEQQVTNQNTQAGNALDLEKLLGTGSLDLQKELGQGQLGLGEQSLNEDYSKFLGNLGLNEAALGNTINQGNVGDITNLLQLLLGGSAQANGGFI